MPTMQPSADVYDLRDFRSPVEEIARRTRVQPLPPGAGDALRNYMPDMTGVAERLAPRAAGGIGAMVGSAARGASALLGGALSSGAQLLMHSGELNSGEDADLAALRARAEPTQGYANGGILGGHPFGKRGAPKVPGMPMTPSVPGFADGGILSDEDRYAGPLQRAANLVPPIPQQAIAAPQFQGNGATGSWAPEPAQPTPQEVERNAGLLQSAKLPAMAAATNAITNRPARIPQGIAAPAAQPAPQGPDAAGYEALITGAMKPDNLQVIGERGGTVPGGPATVRTYRGADGATFDDAADNKSLTPQQQSDSGAYRAYADRQREQIGREADAAGNQMPVVVQDGLARVGNGAAVPADVYWQGENKGGQGRQAIEALTGQQEQIRDAQLNLAKSGYTAEQNKDLEVERMKAAADVQKAKIAAGGGFGEGGMGGGQQGPTGAEFLKTVPSAIGNQVKGLAEGKIPFPSGPALKTPYWQQMMSAVSQYDPTFDAVNYGARAKTRNDFTSGKSAQSLNALNTVAGHLQELSDRAEALNNTRFPIVNQVTNALAGAVGDGRIKDFNTTRKAVVDELTRAYRGSGGSEGDIKSWESNLNAADSPETMHKVLGTMSELLGSKINALGEQYKQGMGTAGGGIQLVTPKAQATFDKLRQRAGLEPLPKEQGASAADEPPAAAIAHLKSNPALRSAFESKYGVSADSYLGK